MVAIAGVLPGLNFHSAALVGIAAVVADGVLVFGRDVLDGGGEEVTGGEDFEIALGAPASAGAVDDPLGFFVPGDLLWEGLDRGDGGELSVGEIEAFAEPIAKTLDGGAEEEMEKVASMARARARNGARDKPSMPDIWFVFVVGLNGGPAAREGILLECRWLRRGTGAHQDAGVRFMVSQVIAAVIFSAESKKRSRRVGVVRSSCGGVAMQTAAMIQRNGALRAWILTMGRMPAGVQEISE